MLHGTPLSPGGAPPAALFLGGQELRVLRIPGAGTGGASGQRAAHGRQYQPPARPRSRGAADHLGGRRRRRAVPSHGRAGLPDIGDVVFIPAGASGPGTPRIIARANYMALAPDHSDVWVEQAGPPDGTGRPAPAWLVGEDGRRLSANRDLGDRALVAATVRGLLVQGPDQQGAFINPQTGGAEPTGIPENAIIAGAGADQVAWQAVACPLRCLLYVTDVQGGPATEIALPPHTAVGPNDTADFDPAGQHFALPLETTDDQGTITGTSVYVADLSTRKLVRVPGGPVPVASLPAVSGAFPAGPVTSSPRAGPPMARGCGSWPPTDFISRWPTGPVMARSACSRPRPAWPTNSTFRGSACPYRQTFGTYCAAPKTLPVSRMAPARAAKRRSRDRKPIRIEEARDEGCS